MGGYTRYNRSVRPEVAGHRGWHRRVRRRRALAVRWWPGRPHQGPGKDCCSPAERQFCLWWRAWSCELKSSFAPVIERFIVVNAAVFGPTAARCAPTAGRSGAPCRYPSRPGPLASERAKKPYTAEEISAYLGLADATRRWPGSAQRGVICLGRGRPGRRELAGARGPTWSPFGGWWSMSGPAPRAVPVLSRYGPPGEKRHLCGPGYLSGTEASRRNVARAGGAAVRGTDLAAWTSPCGPRGCRAGPGHWPRRVHAARPGRGRDRKAARRAAEQPWPGRGVLDSSGCRGLEAGLPTVRAVSCRPAPAGGHVGGLARDARRS